MQVHTIELHIPHGSLGFFAGVFLGRIASSETTKEEKDVAKANYRALKKFFDAKQREEVTEAADKLFPPDEKKWLADGMT